MTENTSEKCCVSSKRCCCKCLCLAALLVGLLGAGVTWFLVPVKHEAQSWFFAYSQVPYTVFQTPEGRGDYETFLATQFAQIKSPMLLQKALMDPAMAQVKELQRQKAPVRWLQQNVDVKRQGRSEYFTISFRSTVPEDAKAIVDAVTLAYMSRYKNELESREGYLAANLSQEKTSYENQVRLQQKALQQLMKQAADAPPEDAQAQEDAANISSNLPFLQARLQRDNQVLDKLSERIAILNTETHSPHRVTLQMEAKLPVEPCNSPLPLAVLVGVALFGLTLLRGFVWRKLG